MSETQLLQEIRLSLGALPDLRLFRNNTGELQDRRGRWVRFGLAPGSPDLIGLRTVTVLPSDVGKQWARFVGLECKTDRGRLSEEQTSFLAMLLDRGALAGVVRSVDDAKRIITGDGLL